jgi:4-aminobutyrate aminotransferase
MTSQELLEREAKVLTPALGWDTSLVVKRGAGAYVETADKERFLDLSCGIATTNIGHNHPKVVEAARRQMEALIHAGCVYHYESIVELGERLRNITPGGIGKFFFSNSGAEAVEGCMKLAKFVTGRPAVIAFAGAFHGRTMGALSLTTSASKYRERYRPLLPEIYHAPFPNAYRHPGSGGAEEACDFALAYLEKMFKQQVKPSEIAAMLVEPVQGEGGYVVAPKRFFQRLRELCTEHGIFLIFDEVQTGMGRTCKWFAAEHIGVTPDIMAMAKGIASGFPLGVVASTPEIMDQWPPGAHGTTFGGNPVSCAASCATIDVIREEKLLEKSAKVSAAAFERLNEWPKKHKAVGDVRGLGLMIGIEFVKPGTKEPDGEAFQAVARHALEKRVILISCGPNGSIIRLIPPLVITEDEMTRALDVIEEGIQKLGA